MARDRERVDRRAALAALISAAVMIAQQVGSKATRDALFLGSFRPEDLPRVVIASAAASMLTVFATSRAYARWGPARVVPGSFAVSAAIYVVEWLLADSSPRAVAVALYLHTAVFGALVISGFWSVVNERFDPHTAKRVVSRIGIGATAGGVVGGLLAERVGEWADAQTMLVVLAVLNAGAALGVTRIGGERAAASEPATSTASAIQILQRAPYLRALAGLVVLTAVSAALLDYAFKAQAAATFTRGSDDLLRFFAIFQVGAAVLSFLLQTSLAKPALQKLGVAGSVATLPIVVLFTATVSAGMTRLASVVVARAAELVVANSIFRSGYELLYTPVAPEKKRPTKALIDVVGNRGGDALGSGLVLVVLALASDLAIPIILALAAVVALLSLWFARRLHRGYVGQLAGMLRDGAPEAMERQLIEAATLQTLSTLGLDRGTLLEQLAAKESWTDRVTHPALDGAADRAPLEPDGIEAPPDDPVHADAALLRRGDGPAIQERLAAGGLDPRLVHHLIALLARRDVYPAVVEALRDMAEDIEDPLLAALTDPDQPFAIRRRLPRVLERLVTRKCAKGLDRGFEDQHFEVRYRCGLALARVVAEDASLRPPLERVHEIVLTEIRRTTRKVWGKRRLLDEDTEDDAPLLERGLRDRINRSVELMFTVLSLSYDPEPLRLSLVALAGEDRTLRGTALEYLENVLPEDVRDALFPMLDARVEIRAKRPPQEIVDDLVRSMQSVDRVALERALDKKP